MKKLYSLGLVIIGFAFLTACSKKSANSNSAQAGISKTEEQEEFKKSGNLSDADLMSIIKGLNTSYSRLEEIEDVLFSNCQLSSSVFRTMIDDARYPDYMVEEMMILSAPVSTADLAYLNNIRPTLSTTSIVLAASVDILRSKFIVLNDNPRQIMFAKNMNRKSTCPEGCGESEFKGADLITITLTSTTTPLEPAEMKPCESGGKWICGTRKRVRLTGTDGTTSTWSVTCTQSTDKCFRDVETAVSNYN